MKPIRLLLADDSSEFLDALTRFLATQPRLEIIGRAYSAAQTLEYVSCLQPDLVLLDLRLPDGNGLEVAHRVRLSPPAPKIIIVTLSDSAEYRAAAEVAGADGFISKSDLAKELLPLISRLFAVLPAGAASNKTPPPEPALDITSK